MIQKQDVDLSVVSVGAKVKLRDVDAKRTDRRAIVGSAEANPAELKLSNESPVGKAIIGKKKGETVEVVDAARLAEVQDPRHRSGVGFRPCCRSAFPTGIRCAAVRDVADALEASATDESRSFRLAGARARTARDGKITFLDLVDQAAGSSCSRARSTSISATSSA